MCSAIFPVQNSFGPHVVCVFDACPTAATVGVCTVPIVAEVAGSLELAHGVVTNAVGVTAVTGTDAAIRPVIEDAVSVGNCW